MHRCFLCLTVLVIEVATAANLDLVQWKVSVLYIQMNLRVWNVPAVVVWVWNPR